MTIHPRTHRNRRCLYFRGWRNLREDWAARPSTNWRRRQDLRSEWPRQWSGGGGRSRLSRVPSCWSTPGSEEETQTLQLQAKTRWHGQCKVNSSRMSEMSSSLCLIQISPDWPWLSTSSSWISASKPILQRRRISTLSASECGRGLPALPTSECWGRLPTLPTSE